MRHLTASAQRNTKTDVGNVALMVCNLGERSNKKWVCQNMDVPCLPIVLRACQQNMIIMLDCMSLAELFAFLCYLVFAIDCMFVIDFGFSDSLFGWHFFDLRTVCVVYALALKIQQFVLRDCNKMQFPDKSVMEPFLNPDTPWSHVHQMQAPDGIPHGAIIKYSVELLNHKVNKTVMIPQQERLDVRIDRNCLFAADVFMTSSTDGVFIRSPQKKGLVCPCCNKSQKGWDNNNSIKRPSQNVKLKIRGSSHLSWNR